MKSLQGFPPGGGLASLIKTLTNPSFLIGYSKKTGPLRKFKSDPLINLIRRSKNILKTSISDQYNGYPTTENDRNS